VTSRLSQFSRLVAILSVATFCSTRLDGQNPPASQVILSPHIELVAIQASVLDKQGNFVAGLPHTRFRVLDNGAQQPIVLFAPVEERAKTLVMLETSPAVYLIHDEHLVATYALVDSLAGDDQVALMTYNETSQVVLPFTSEKGALLAALGQTQYALGTGNLDLSASLSTAFDWLRPMTGKKAIVLITTGLDSSPPDRWGALIQKLRSEDVVIFSVALGGALRDAPGKRSKRKRSIAATPDEFDDRAADSAKASAAFAKADEALRSLATISGGRAYFPQSDKDFVPIYREIATALRHQYLLGIAPAHDNQFHQLTVEVLDSSRGAAGRDTKTSDDHVFARAGYLAPGP
jgi:Ca-activated chloride channel homolog